MITVDQARELFSASAKCRQSVEMIPIERALLRIAASDLVSSIAVPPTNNSAMDGFAINSADLELGETEMEISQRIPAGKMPSDHILGTASRIFTGGVLPKGADAVVIQEHCEISSDAKTVKILTPVSSGKNIRKLGQDISIDEKVISKGQRLSAIDLGLIAAIGVAEVSVYTQVCVAVFSTGNELIEPGLPLKPGQTYNSNRTMLLSLCEQLGYRTIDCGIVEDTFQATKTALSKAAEQADLVLSSGGVSVGEEDHIKPVIEDLGELNNWKVKMKPGKPVVLGMLDDTPILGLPGNPVSSYIVFLLLGVPLLQALQGQNISELISYPVSAGFSKDKTIFEEYIRVRLMTSDDGRQVVEIYNNQSSGVLSSLAWADGFVRQQIDQEIKSGDIVDFLPLREGLL